MRRIPAWRPWVGYFLDRLLDLGYRDGDVITVDEARRILVAELGYTVDTAGRKVRELLLLGIFEPAVIVGKRIIALRIRIPPAYASAVTPRSGTASSAPPARGGGAPRRGSPRSGSGTRRSPPPRTPGA